MSVPVKKAMLRRSVFYLFLLLLFAGCAGFSVQNSSKAPGSANTSKNIRSDDNLILLPSGSYKDIDGNIHTVKSFYLSPYEVTQGEWKRIMKVNPSEFNGTGYFPPFPGEDQDKRPVEMISWFQALEFCNAKSIEEGLTPFYSFEGSLKNKTALKNPHANGYRLPTVKEWEYAALSAGKDAFMYAGTNKTQGTLGLNAHAWFTDNADFATHEIGIKLSNSLGFYDMSGNVFEWCEDDLSSASVSGVWKGGCAISGPEECRISYKGEYLPDTRNSFTGLRLARNAP